MPATSSPRPTAQGFCPWEAVTVTLSSHPPLTPLSGLPCAPPVEEACSWATRSCWKEGRLRPVSG